jgi:hypothetical protein
MTPKGLDILRRATKPKTPEEIQAFLVKRHGAVSRENASSDVSALDERARQEVSTPQKKYKTPAC